MPINTISARRVNFDVGFKNLFTVIADIAIVLMGMKTGVFNVGFQLTPKL